MLIELIIKFEMREPGPCGRTSTTGYFYDVTKQKSLRNIAEWIILFFTAKILQEAMYLTSPQPGPNDVQNLTPKC